MRRLLTWIAAATITAFPVLAAERPVVVELYTSQGCSSCPPADAFLHELAKRDNVIALALHVDYWDYIGWKDSFADPQNTERQRGYARAAERKVIYTPQMVINGADDVVGNRAKDVEDLIARHSKLPDNVAMTVKRDGAAVVIEATQVASFGGPLTVQLLQYRPRSTVSITRGENAGRTIDYANVVTRLDVLGTWDGTAPLQLSAPVDADAPVVVLMQQNGGAGLVEAAAMVE